MVLPGAPRGLEDCLSAGAGCRPHRRREQPADRGRHVRRGAQVAAALPWQASWRGRALRGARPRGLVGHAALAAARAGPCAGACDWTAPGRGRAAAPRHVSRRVRLGAARAAAHALRSRPGAGRREPDMKRAAIVLTPRRPWPLDDGGRIGLWQVLWSAAQAYDVTLLTLVPQADVETAAPPEVERLGIRVVTVAHEPPPLPVAAWRGVVGRWPFTLERYASQALRSRLLDLVRDLEPALILVNHLHLYPAVADLEGTPFVLREHNVEFSWMARYGESQGFSPRGLFARLQVSRMRKTEAEACRRAALVLAIQAQEAGLLRAIAP